MFILTSIFSSPKRWSNALVFTSSVDGQVRVSLKESCFLNCGRQFKKTTKIVPKMGADEVRVVCAVDSLESKFQGWPKNRPATIGVPDSISWAAHIVSHLEVWHGKIANCLPVIRQGQWKGCNQIGRQIDEGKGGF
jgi:hypothetical protein